MNTRFSDDKQEVLHDRLIVSLYELTDGNSIAGMNLDTFCKTMIDFAAARILDAHVTQDCMSLFNADMLSAEFREMLLALQNARDIGE